MVYSREQRVWCVQPTQHTNLQDVVDWCYSLWGQHKIDNVQSGSWSYCSGDFYGLTRDLGKYEIPERNTCFAFDDKKDAMWFKLKWS